MLSTLSSFFFPSESVKCECCGKTNELYSDECSSKCSCGAILLVQAEPGMRYVKHNCVEGQCYFMVKKSRVLLRCTARCSAFYIVGERIVENICGQDVYMAEPLLDKLHTLEKQKEKLKKEVLSLSADKASSQAKEMELKEEIRVLNENHVKKIEEMEELSKTMKKEMAASHVAMFDDMNRLNEVALDLMERLEVREEELEALRKKNNVTTEGTDEGLGQNSVNEVPSPTGDFAECEICQKTKIHFNTGKWFTHCPTPTCDGNLLLAELSKKYRYVTAAQCDPMDVFYCDANVDSFICPHCYKEHIIDTENPKVMNGQKVFTSKPAMEVVEENKKTIEKNERDYASLKKNFALMVKINTSLLEKVRNLEESKKNE